MKYKFLLIVIFLTLIILFLYLTFSQAPVQDDKYTKIKWSKAFGGGDQDKGSFVLYSDDGGCIVTGHTESYGLGMADLWLIKVDKNGEEQWSKTFGGSKWEEGKGIEILDDGTYAVIGKTSSFGTGKTDIWLIKVDKTGKEQWNKTLGGPEWEEGNSIKKTTNGGFIIAGDTTSYSVGDYDAWLIKVDENGAEQWNRSFGGINTDAGRSVELTRDDGYILAGETQSFGNGGTDIWLIKVNETGIEQWNTTIGSENEEYCNQIIESDDGGFVVAGHYIIKEGDDFKLNGFVVKIDSDGNVLWKRVVSTDKAVGTSSIDKIDDGYIVGGFIGEDGDEQDLFIGKIDFSGNVIWTNSIGGKYGDTGIWIERGKDTNYFVTGYKDVEGVGINDLWVLKFDVFN